VTAPSVTLGTTQASLATNPAMIQATPALPATLSRTVSKDGSLLGFELGFVEGSDDGCNDGWIYIVEDGFEDGSPLGFELGFVGSLMMAAAKAGETASRTASKMARHLVLF
jgi:hypothetical protein